MIGPPAPRGAPGAISTRPPHSSALPSPGPDATHPVERDPEHPQARRNDLMDRIGFDLGAGGPRAA